jgi:large subunit ribosomal protein L24e
MALAKCFFCGCEQEDFYGTYLIKNDGTMPYYCSQKCIKNNLKLGRDKRKLKWTAAFHEARGKKIVKHNAEVAAKK